MPMNSFFEYVKLTFKQNNGLGGVSLLKHLKIFKEWKMQLQSKKQPLDLEVPWITVVAKDYILEYLNKKQKKETRIFEYGSGGSSLFFLNNAAEVVSAEHNEEWFNRVKDIIAHRNIQGWEGCFSKAEPIEKSLQDEKREAGNPDHYYSDDDNFKEYVFKNYASTIEKFQDNYFDIVLVDGRSRPSCIKHSVNKVKKGGLLVLDNAERGYYLHNDYLNNDSFELVLSLNGALICYPSFTKTIIYLKK
jgi:predicted O-methyltransferase YrrM